MIRGCNIFGIFIACLLQATAITVESHSPRISKPISLNRDDLDQLLRMVQQYTERPSFASLKKHPNPTLSRLEEPPKPESFNYFVLVKPGGGGGGETEDHNDDQQRLVDDFSDDIRPRKIPKKYPATSKRPPVQHQQEEKRGTFPLSSIQDANRMLSLIFEESEHRDANPFPTPIRELRGHSVGRVPSFSQDADSFDYRGYGLQPQQNYKFGYAADKGKRQRFREEEGSSTARPKGGSHGHRTGKSLIVKYTANPDGGFRIEKVQQ